MSFLAFAEKNWMLFAPLVASGAMLIWLTLQERARAA